MAKIAKPLSFYYRIQTGGCWIWIGGRNGSYGTCRYKGTPTPAHIAVYLHIKGNYSRVKELHHTCTNTLCVNPEHLEPLYKYDHMLKGNSLQAINARKTHCPRGHEYTKENTFKYKDGRRDCRICQLRRTWLKRGKIKEL